MSKTPAYILWVTVAMLLLSADGGWGLARTGRTTPSSNLDDFATVKELVFYHEALRLIDQDQKQLRRAGTTMVEDLWPHAKLEGRISIKVELDDAVKLHPFRFYRAYNNYVHPAWVYKVATGPGGEVFGLGGFPGHDFNALISKRLRAARASDFLEILAAYYQTVEDYKPGLLANQGDVALAIKLLQASSSLPAEIRERAKTQIAPPVITTHAGRLTATVFVFDSSSLRTEQDVARLSQEAGLVIEHREILLDAMSPQL